MLLLLNIQNQTCSLVLIHHMSPKCASVCIYKESITKWLLLPYTFWALIVVSYKCSLILFLVCCFSEHFSAPKLKEFLRNVNNRLSKTNLSQPIYAKSYTAIDGKRKKINTDYKVTELLKCFSSIICHSIQNTVTTWDSNGCTENAI